jgi:hypothetical protein
MIYSATGPMRAVVFWDGGAHASSSGYKVNMFEKDKSSALEVQVRCNVTAQRGARNLRSGRTASIHSFKIDRRVSVANGQLSG